MEASLVSCFWEPNAKGNRIKDKERTAAKTRKANKGKEHNKEKENNMTIRKDC